MAVRVQDHIHLSETLSGSPENSPDETFTAVFNGGASVNVATEGILEVKRALNGYAHINFLPDSNGDPVLYKNFSYVIKLYKDSIIGWQKYAAILSMFGKSLYFVSHFHPDDGEDHADYVVQYVVLDAIGAPIQFDPMLNYMTVEIALRDVTQYGIDLAKLGLV